MLSKVKVFWDDLPNWAKGISALAAIAIPTYVGFVIYKNAQDAKKKKEAIAKLLIAKGDLDDLAKRGITPSFSETQYNTWSDSIFSAFDGCDYSVGVGRWYSWDLLFASDGFFTVNDILKQFKNDADFIALQLAFGNKTIRACRLGLYAGSATDMTLASAVKNELDIATEVKELNKTLESKNISYRF